MKGGIDFHVHPVLTREMVARHPELERAARETYFVGNNFQPLEVMLLEMDLCGIEKAVVVPVDATTSCNATVYTNEQIVEICAMSDRLIGFASVDPRQPEAPEKLERAVSGLGLRGLKLSPAMQGFFPDDPLAFPVYEKARDLGIPVLFHAGLSWQPGSKLKYGHPLRFEDVAAAFPDLNIVLAHLAWPWVVEAVALALKYPNVYLDTSALYFDNPVDFLRYAMTQQVPLTVFERSLRKQLVFGSDNPRIETKAMAKAVRSVGLSDECLELVFRGNAERLLGGRV
jgi:predicted TIM-barrel fold metal-dependent hydrolase